MKVLIPIFLLARWSYQATALLFFYFHWQSKSKSTCNPLLIPSALGPLKLKSCCSNCTCYRPTVHSKVFLFFFALVVIYWAISTLGSLLFSRSLEKNSLNSVKFSFGSVRYWREQTASFGFLKALASVLWVVPRLWNYWCGLRKFINVLELDFPCLLGASGSVPNFFNYFQRMKLLALSRWGLDGWHPK